MADNSLEAARVRQTWKAVAAWGTVDARTAGSASNAKNMKANLSNCVSHQQVQVRRNCLRSRLCLIGRQGLGRLVRQGRLKLEDFVLLNS